MFNKEPNLVAECLSKNAIINKLPVTVKTRIGYDDVEEIMKIYIILLEKLKSTGVKTFYNTCKKSNA